MRIKRPAVSCSALVLTLSIAGACSDSDSSSGDGGSAGAAAGGGDAAAGSGGEGAQGATGGVASGGSAGSSSGGISGTGGTAGTPFDAGDAAAGDSAVSDAASDAADAPTDASCALTLATALPPPLDMYILSDKSSSLGGTGVGACNSGSGKTCWEDIKAAIKAFVSDPAAAGVGVGIQYFPVLPAQYATPCTSSSDCGSYGPCTFNFCRSCDVSHYSVPAVPITVLPDVPGTINASVDSITPFGGTPTGPALQGTVTYTTGWAQANPGRRSTIVLATDGYPNDCTPTDINSIATIASGVATGPYKILTFVIGLGTQLTNLNTIASAGGTTKAYLLDTAANVQVQFLQTMKDIQNRMLGCEYAIPKLDAGAIDPNKLTVLFTPTGGSPIIINKVTDAAQCGSTNGFYYDVNSSPTKFFLCPSTCNAVRADPSGKVEMNFPCPGS